MKLIKKVIFNYYYIFFFLSALQVLNLDLRLIPVIKVLLFGFSITFMGTFLHAKSSNSIFLLGRSLLLLFVFYFFLSGLSYYDANKPIAFFLNGIIVYIVPLCSFFFSFSLTADNEKKLYKKIENALLLCCIVGIVLYFWSPAWYISWRLDSYADWVGTDNAISVYEQYNNLSSVFTHPYYVSFTGVFLISVFLNRIYNNIDKKKNVIFFFLTLLTLILAQQRVTIVFVISLVLLYSIIGIFNGRKIFLSIIIILFISVLYLIIRYYDIIEFLIERYTSVFDSKTLVSGRTDIAYKLLDSNYNVIFGEGANLTGHIAIQYGKACIPDSEYLKFFYELGFLGSFIFFSYAFLTIYIAWKYKLYIELPIVMFFVFAMYGANPFEKDNIILLYWICSGRVWRKVLELDRIHKFYSFNHSHNLTIKNDYYLNHKV